MIVRSGGLVENTVSLVSWGDEMAGERSRRPKHEARICRRTPNVLIGETPVLVTWDEPIPGVDRPWWSCPVCSARCRFLYLRGGAIGCWRCLGLRFPSRHVYKQTPGIHRITRWRRQIKAEERPFGSIPRRPRNHAVGPNRPTNPGRRTEAYRAPQRHRSRPRPAHSCSQGEEEVAGWRHEPEAPRADPAQGRACHR